MMDAVRVVAKIVGDVHEEIEVGHTALLEDANVIFQHIQEQSDVRVVAVQIADDVGHFPQYPLFREHKPNRRRRSRN